MLGAGRVELGIQGPLLWPLAAYSRTGPGGAAQRAVGRVGIIPTI